MLFHTDPAPPAATHSESRRAGNGGVLVTHEGEYGPGSFVWFPEGGWMEHGATDENECTFLFITNKPFGICYESDEEHPYPMDS